MGSPLGPTLANTFPCFYQGKWLEKCLLEFKPVFYILVIFLFYLNQPIISKNFATTLIIVTRKCPFHLRKKKTENVFF